MFLWFKVSGMRRVQLLLLREAGQWTAISLQQDIAAGGLTPEAAVAAWLKALKGEIRLRQQMPETASIPKAPDVYWHWFAAGEAFPYSEPTPGVSLEVRRKV